MNALIIISTEDQRGVVFPLQLAPRHSVEIANDKGTIKYINDMVHNIKREQYIAPPHTIPSIWGNFQCVLPVCPVLALLWRFPDGIVILSWRSLARGLPVWLYGHKPPHKHNISVPLPLVLILNTAISSVRASEPCTIAI